MKTCINCQIENSHWDICSDCVPKLAKEVKKICTKCKTILPHEKFYKDKYRRDGLYLACKLCHNQDCKRFVKKLY